VATGGFFFKKVEGGRATLHDNGKGKSCSLVWFTEVQALLIRGKVRGHHGSHCTNMVVSIARPERRLARSIVVMQTYDIDVLYERGDGELIAVPDALSRDTMDKDIVLCHRCLEAVDAVSEDGSRNEEGTCRKGHESESREEDFVTVAEMAAAQVEAYGGGAVLFRNEDRLRDEDGLICQVFGKGDVRVLVPPALRSKVLKLVHGNKLGGHWGILRTAAMVRCRYYWPGWASDVRKAVLECLACDLGRLRRPGGQARMVRYHPSRRFQMVAMDVLEMSPETKRGNRKVLVIGDMFPRYLVAVPMSDESADTVARVFFDRWVSVFGPPEQLLTDLGPNIASGVIVEMCRL
jgi:Integrase zinc binding domain